MVRGFPRSRVRGTTVQGSGFEVPRSRVQPGSRFHGFLAQGSGFQGSGFLGSRFGVPGSRVRGSLAQGSGFGVPLFKVRGSLVQGSGFRGPRFGVSCEHRQKLGTPGLGYILLYRESMERASQIERAYMGPWPRATLELTYMAI